ncbi:MULTISPECIES: hypothetical protein [Clostridium]|uniref:Uncharacterized protein n=1 Tax=Clostridium lapidicellarium TaxID=3240931 RepID=A0ABV4DX49_9CLOT|nr:hypothetical protein [uncultured Clostridium sp.]
MEFRLNKIDPEVRQRVREATNANKVHNKRKIFVDGSDNKNKEKKGGGSFETELGKYKQEKSKEEIVVQATRTEEVKVNAFREQEGSISMTGSKGSIIDVKK